MEKLNINLENFTFRWFILYNYITINIAKNTKKEGHSFHQKRIHSKEEDSKVLYLEHCAVWS